MRKLNDDGSCLSCLLSASFLMLELDKPVVRWKESVGSAGLALLQTLLL